MWHDTQTRFDTALKDFGGAAPAGVTGGRKRFDVYRNNISVSLTNALGETFPLVRRLVGNEFFTAMARTYIQKNRPASPVLFEYGATFGDFIDTFEPAYSVPYLGDVARFERAWLDVYHAADSSPLGIDVLSDIPEDCIGNLGLALHPALHVFKSDHPAVSIWRTHQDSETPEFSVPTSQSEYALIVRPDIDVHVIDLSMDGYNFIAGLAAGETLGTVCETVPADPEFDPSRQLADLFSAGAVVALDHHR